MGEHMIDRARWDWDEVERNPFFCPDAEQAKFFEDYLDDIRKRGSSVGAVIEIVAEGVPAGPRRADLRQARRRSRGGAHGHQRGQGRRDRRRLCGRGRSAARRTPTKCAWATTASRCFLSNHAGGILGGISTGQPIVCRFAVKPTSSILTPRRHGRPLRRRDRDHAPKAATTPASASARCRSARPWWRACSPITICVIAGRWASRPHGRSPAPDQEVNERCSTTTNASKP